jgi:hypothetical protein
MLRHAFKEWAVICEALAKGRQSLILRKGGVDENFTPQHTRFWLFPTYLHEDGEGIKQAAAHLLDLARADRPPDGVVRLSHFAEVAGVYYIRDLFGALMLDDMHLWSEATVRRRFAYREPGLYVLPVRVYRADRAHELTNTPAYDGCRSWVELERELPTDGARPVIPDRAYADLLQSLQRRLTPTAEV